MKENNEKHLEYAAAITDAICSVFEEDSDWAIDEKELMEGEKLTHFIHAMTNVAPTYLFNKLTGGDKNMLELNHIANKLCFQYSEKE